MSRLWDFAAGVKRRFSRTAHRLWAGSNVPLILMYHRIAEADADPWGLALSPALFNEQLELLKQQRLVLPLIEFGRLHRRGRLPANATAITFDDGYACNALTAAPLLEKHGLPAIIFLTTGMISSSEEFWWDALEHMMLTTDAEKLNLSINGETASIALGNRDEVSVSSNWDATRKPESIRQAAYLRLWATLRGADDGERRRAMGALRRQAGVTGPARQSHRVMTASEVRGISASGLIEIGAHSVTHPALSQWTRAQQASEITRSRDACRELVGYQPRAFAYPYGDYDDDTVKIVGEAGFQIACTAHSSGVAALTPDLRMPRLHVRAWRPLEITAAMRRVDRE
jgi:peptidoglycan/xylan/chitin deacetylase (PgdA/CDA1 family)